MASARMKSGYLQWGMFSRFHGILGNCRSEVTALLLGALLLSCGRADAVEAERPDTPIATFEHMAMGTRFEMVLCAPDATMGEEELQDIADRAFAAIDALEKRISNWRDDSETGRINRLAAEDPVKISSAQLQLLMDAKRIHEMTGGAFDVTVGPILELWGFYRKEGHLPAQPEIDQALTKVGLSKVEVDEQGETVRFSVPGMRLDFDGIAKGLAAERAANILKSLGVTSGVVNAGTSTVEAIGSPPGQAGWTVRVRDPYNKEGEHIAEVRISNESLSTSSSSENFLELEGKKYGHIVDPKTGWPVGGVVSTTVIGPRGLETDALATAFFVMGEAKVRAFCEAHREFRAILVISEDGAPRVVRINFPS